MLYKKACRGKTWAGLFIWGDIHVVGIMPFLDNKKLDAFIMAIWQYTFQIIPNEDIAFLGTCVQIDMADYDKIDFWTNEKYNEAFFIPLTDSLQKGKSWSDAIVLYGDEESNCISLVIKKQKVTEASLRVDYRTDYSFLLRAAVEFCSLNSLLLLDEDLNILPLNATNMEYTIKTSPQYTRLQEMLK